jgi:hypothetical protein
MLVYNRYGEYMGFIWNDGMFVKSVEYPEEQYEEVRKCNET